VIDLLLDEIAAREGIAVRVFGTGAKMGKDEAAETGCVKNWAPDFMVMISPTQALRARQQEENSGKTHQRSWSLTDPRRKRTGKTGTGRLWIHNSSS